MKREVIAKVVGCNMTLDFNYKPNIQERNAMKACHFRWSPDKGVWYGKSTPESRKMANGLKYLKDFVPTPKATAKDFAEWVQALKNSDWDSILMIAQDIFKKSHNGEEALNQVLHEKFVSQWS